MCGRITLSAPPATLAEWFDVETPIELQPHWNIAPSQNIAVIPNASSRAITMMRWGLVPRWAKDPRIGHRLINARAETVAEKPAFRDALRRRRCLVLADGFYEWQRHADGHKVPMVIRAIDGGPFALAGLWETWSTPEGGTLHSCTIVTTSPNALMEPIHDRMPVILPPDAYALWLSPEERPPAALQSLLVPYPDDRLTAFAVSTLVNNPRNDVAECATPL